MQMLGTCSGKVCTVCSRHFRGIRERTRLRTILNSCSIYISIKLRVDYCFLGFFLAVSLTSVQLTVIRPQWQYGMFEPKTTMGINFVLRRPEFLIQQIDWRVSKG